MASCCSPFARAANHQFDRRKVAQEVARYREKGPGRTTRLLADAIADCAAPGGTVLDIGAGFGSLTLALLDRGAERAVIVDASSAYVDAAREEAARRGQCHAIELVHADFVEAAPRLPSAAVVCLDRVVCCYPACERLLDAALGHAGRCIALAYPRDVWYVRLAVWLENAGRWLARNPFRTFVHPAAAIEKTIQRAGFVPARRHETWMWAVSVHAREC